MPNKFARRREDNEEEVVVYREGRTLYFFDDIDEESVCKAIRFLDALDKESKKEINIIINSPGGNAYDGLALYDRIRQSPCEITMTGTGLVASMALIVFLAGDERKITENAKLLNHQITQYDFDGRMSDYKIEGKEIEELQATLTEIISERTGESIKKITNDILPGDKWISANYALNNGYADSLIKNTRTYRRKKGKENEK